MNPNTARTLMERNVRNLNAATTAARELLAAMMDLREDKAREATEALLAFIRGLDDDAREQLTINAFTMLVQVQGQAEDRRRNG